MNSKSQRAKAQKARIQKAKARIQKTRAKIQQNRKPRNKPGSKEEPMKPDEKPETEPEEKPETEPEEKPEVEPEEKPEVEPDAKPEGKPEKPQGSILNTLFNKIFIINLDSRKDRWNECLKELKSAKIYNYERISASCVKYKDIDKKFITNYCPRFRGDPKYIEGAYGCKMSHYRVIKLAKERNYRSVLILEDDFKFRTGYQKKLTQVTNQFNFAEKDWDMVYFGGNIGGRRSPNKNVQIEKISGVLTTHAYAVHQSIYDKILNTCLLSKTEIDKYYKHTFGKTSAVFITKPSIITQRDSFSNIRNIVKRNDRVLV